MATRLNLSNQLATLGMHLPVWPEEPEGCHDTGDLIQRGQAYAEGVRLWRAQLRNAAECVSEGGIQLIPTMQAAGRLSRWDHSIIHYLLSELEGNSCYQRVQAVAKLVTAEGLTDAQLFGAALDLVGCGYVVSGLFAVKRVFQEHHNAEKKGLVICSLLIANFLCPTRIDETDQVRAGESWLEQVGVYMESVHLLVIAACIASGDTSCGNLVAQLEKVAQAACTQSLKIEESQTYAIQLATARVKCKQVHASERPLLRTIHHFACTGGTVISKCLAAMPNVALISEINPRHRAAGGLFQPTNPLLSLERSYRQLTEEEIKEEFLRQIVSIMEICACDDVDLIIRDHSHTDFCMGPQPSSICPVVDYLSNVYTVNSVVTVRHPLDSYLSLLSQKWETQFTPSTLDEYCRRYQIFLDRYSGMPLRRYEDFCAESGIFMEDVCQLLEISYHPAFEKHFQNISISGASGRKNQGKIGVFPRRPVPPTVRGEIETSASYKELICRLGYV